VGCRGGAGLAEIGDVRGAKLDLGGVVVGGTLPKQIVGPPTHVDTGFLPGPASIGARAESGEGALDAPIQTISPPAEGTRLVILVVEEVGAVVPRVVVEERPTRVPATSNLRPGEG
jgi:hypothetical protein